MIATYPEDVEEFVEEEVTSGRFRSRDELFVEAVRLFRQLKVQHSELKAEIAESLEQEERGETMVFNAQQFIREQRAIWDWTGVATNAKCPLEHESLRNAEGGLRLSGRR